MYAVIVNAKESSETVAAFGPYRSLRRADIIRNLCLDPHSAEYFDSEEYFVFITLLSRYE